MFSSDSSKLLEEGHVDEIAFVFLSGNRSFELFEGFAVKNHSSGYLDKLPFLDEEPLDPLQ
jgi:hypothetical protein